jgi:pSer/pThr/pTyr-binding forkhead associated (FHA) protein
VVDDPDASRQHFEVTRVLGGRCIVYDLGSKNGLRVNGQSVDSHTLAAGDEITAGRTRLRFIG